MGNDSLGVTSEVYKNQLRFHNLYLWNNWAELNLVRTFPFIHFEPLTKKKKKRKKEILKLTVKAKEKKKKTNLKFCVYFVCSDFSHKDTSHIGPNIISCPFPVLLYSFPGSREASNLSLEIKSLLISQSQNE